MSANESVVITVREDGAVVVKRNLLDMGSAGTTAAKGIDAVKTALGQMTTGIRNVTPVGTAMQQRLNEITGVSMRMERAVRDSASAFNEILSARDKVDALRASMDPAYAAQMKFNAGFDLLESALASGAIKNQQYDATLKLLITDYDGTAAAAREAAAAEAQLASTKETLQARVDMLRSSYDPLFASSKRYESAVETLDSALAAGILKMSQYDAMLENLGDQYLKTAVQSKSLGQAGANTANLFAQFNDIGVMLAAGQNPFQLALQQGTQISQVLTQISASGGGMTGMLRALGSGFMALINPITLVTIGVIAFGAMAFQAISKLWPETVTLKQRLDDMSKAMSDYSQIAVIASGNTVDLTNKFGTAGKAIGQAAQVLAQFAQAKAISAMQAAIKGLSEQFGGLSRTMMVSTDDGILTQIDNTMFKIRDQFNLTLPVAAQLTLGLEAMSKAATPQDAIVASQQFNDLLIKIYGSAAQVPLAFQDMALAAGQVAQTGGEILSKEQQIAAAQQANLILQYQRAGASRIASNAALADAQQMIAGFQQQTKMQQLIAQYGDQSLQVTKARQAAEMALLQTKVNAMNISATEKQLIMDAAAQTDAAINATNAWAGAMAGVAAQIRGILSALASLSGTVIANASRQVEIDALKAGATVAQAHIAATKDQIERETTMKLAGAQNIFEKGLVYLQRGAQLRSVDQESELSGLQAIATARDRANTGGSGGSGPKSPTDAGEQVRLENQILKQAIDERIGFVTKLDAVNALLQSGAQGYTKTDAFNTLSNESGMSDLFAGTQEAIDAQVQRFQDMYAKIDLMRQSDIISEKSAAQAKAAVDAKYGELRLSNANSVFGELAKLSSSHNKTLAAIGKAAAVAQATIDGILAVQKALASMPPPWNYAMAAAIGATTGANVAAILSTNTNFATGGSFMVPGTGGVDTQLVGVRASPGERVTIQTPAQVRKGSEAPGMGGGGGGGQTVVNARIVNVMDKGIVGDYLATDEGETLIMNVLHKNSDKVKSVINNG